MLGINQHLFVPPHRALQPEAFITHAASLRQTFVHCARFPTAASRRKSGPCLSSSVADHPLRPATRLWLGWAITPPTT